MINIAIDKGNTFAVIGASNNSEKYGYKVTRDMLDRNFKVYPVNLHEKEILGEKVYSTIGLCPPNIDVVVFIVPPKITLKVLGEVVRLGIKNVWFQPGSDSPEILKYCDNNDLNYIQACIMKSEL